MKFFRSEKAAGRLHLERQDAGHLLGWCAQRDGSIAEVALLIDGAPALADVVRLQRRDVCAALGSEPTTAYGFLMTLPADIWRKDGQSRAVAIEAAGKRVGVALPASLDDWLARLQVMSPGEELERCLRAAARHVAALGGLSRLPDHLARWLEAQARQRSFAEALSDPNFQFAPMPKAMGTVEAQEGLVVRGWAWSGGDSPERIVLRAQGREVEVSVVRTARQDVQKVTGAARVSLGFELEIPGRLWRDFDHDTSLPLEVLVGHDVLSGASLTLSQQQLLEEFGRLREEQARLETPSGSRVDPHEHQYSLLLALEHLAESRLMRELPEELALFAATQAERFGLSDLLAGGKATQGTAVDAALLTQDYTTELTWRLLREFNERLRSVDGPPIDVLDVLLQEVRPQSEVRHRFLLSLIPFFCGRASYPLLRPYLDVWRLRALSSATGSWECSLLLPESVASGDLEGAAKLLEKITKAPQGWLNTECVSEACRILQAHQGQATLPGSVVGDFVLNLVSLVETLSADAWDRSHDLHLVDAMVSMIELMPAIPALLAERVEKAAITAYALVPTFWTCLRRRLPDDAAWPAQLRNVRASLPRLDRFIQSNRSDEPARVWPLLPLLSALHRSGNVDEPQVSRELIQAMAGQLQSSGAEEGAAAFAALEAVSQSDALRLAAHPLVDPELLADGPDLKHCIRAISGLPPVLEGGRMAAAFKMAAGDPAQLPSLQACKAVATAPGGWMGVYWVALRWSLRRASVPEVDRDAELSAVRELWVGALASQASGSAIPAPLIGAYSCLLSEFSRAPAQPLERLLAEMKLSLGSAATLVEPPDQSVLEWRGEGVGTLVAIYSCRRNLDSRVARIRETWARHLTRLGIPWIVVVGEGEGLAQLDGDVLALPVSDAYEALPEKTIALVRWVYEHTNFGHVLKIDDDCHLSVEAFFAESPHLAQHYLGRRLHRAEGGTDRRWHQAKSRSDRGRFAIDKSPEPSIYADGGAGYCLSRFAMGSLLSTLETTAGARLARSAFMEDKLVGDLLKRCAIDLSSQGYETLVRRRWGKEAVPVNSHQNVFFPSDNSPTLVSHLDDAEQLSRVEAVLCGQALLPARIWPSCHAPALGGLSGTNQLELLSPVEGVRTLRNAPVIVVAVARNELVLMPHFLAHYRALGVQHFILVDNLSDDGTREYLLAQNDVVLYSADTEYRYSHYGVAWQQAVLGAHALGKWVILADIDEFLIYPECEQRSVVDWLGDRDREGAQAVLTLMVDMYPAGDLAHADFAQQSPFEVACYFDRQPFIEWRLGSGCFSNGPTYLSALRHRLMPDSAPNFYTAQKVAILRYMPWVRLSEGLHYASNVNVAERPVVFSHFKYHAGFNRKVQEEVARKQHFNGAEEYRKYSQLLRESESIMRSEQRSDRYFSSVSYLDIYNLPVNDVAGG